MTSQQLHPDQRESRERERERESSHRQSSQINIFPPFNANYNNTITTTNNNTSQQAFEADVEAHAQRRFYSHKPLHVAMLRLLLRLIISPDPNNLNPLYCSRFPLSNKHTDNPMSHNVLYLLHRHLNHKANESAVADLLRRECAAHSHAVWRLLKLLCARLFDGSNYRKCGRFFFVLFSFCFLFVSV
jgi:hypothetical protein